MQRRKPKRILGTYYRVAFFGEPWGELSQCEFIYKEPQITQLSEIALRLEKMYKARFGEINVIRDAGREATARLDMKRAHFQVTHVEPFLTDSDKAARTTNFERNHDICRFSYEVLVGRPSVAEREIERIVLTTEDTRSFPYLKKRCVHVPHPRRTHPLQAPRDEPPEDHAQCAGCGD